MAPISSYTEKQVRDLIKTSDSGMPYPDSVTQSTRNKTVSPVTPLQLNTTQNNKSFYVYSGETTISGETTVISISDIGERDILICFELGTKTVTGNDCTVRIKSNGTTIYANETTHAGGTGAGYNELKFIIPANTSLDVTLEQDYSLSWTVAGYGTYLEH